MALNPWLERELQRGLREVAAPPELWDRVQSARVIRPQEGSRKLVWALALTVALSAVGLSLIRPPAHTDSQTVAIHCQNPAQLRAWEVARATDVSGTASPSKVTGPRVTLAGNNSAALQLACKLCHLD